MSGSVRQRPPGDGRSGRLRLRLCVLLMLLSLVPPGCVVGAGLTCFGPVRGEISDPYVSIDFLSRERHVGPIGRGAGSSSADLLASWGEPDRVERLDDGTELWTYRAGLRWVGVLMLVVIVPVPLGVPIGRARVTFVVEDGRLTAARSRDTMFRSWAGAMWAPTFLHGGGWTTSSGSAPGQLFTNPFD